jgi:signal transduction histidine kinase
VEIGALLLVMGVVLRMTITDLHWALRRARREVKERKAAEAALARSHNELEERVAARTADLARTNHELQTLIESSQDGILFVTGDLRLSVINSRALELLGLSGTPHDWQGRLAGGLFDEIEERASSSAASVRVELARLWAGSVDGEEAPVEGEFEVGARSLYWYVVPVAVDEELADLVVLRDVTSNRQLEQLRNELVHTMVHDLRNPLSGMLSMLSLLTILDRQQQEELAPRQRRYVGRLTESVEYMSRLVNNILDVYRLENGQLPLQRANVEINELVTETVEAQRTLAAEKELSVTSSVSPGLPAAWVDKAVVERVLKNLLDNAIKFTSSGGKVWVATVPAAEGNGNPAMVRVSVHDTGPGISPELRPRLFQKFSAGDQVGAGSGLGLAFCKLAVEAHGGQLWLQDRSENAEIGSSFVFTVPAAVQGST